MKSSQNLAALIHFKEKFHKWKNIAFLLGIFSTILVVKFLFIGDMPSDIVGDYIANVKIEGVIFEDDHRTEILEKLADEPSVKAVIVNVNSPGGGIVGSEIVFNNLRAIAKNKPIVVVMGSVAASGGYMASIASDYIIAYNGTLTGSIGVLMESPEVTTLANKIGVKFNTYKSSPLKGSPSPFEKSSPAVDAVINESIQDSYKFFADLVKERRGKKLSAKLGGKIFDGRVFTGRQALEAGLVDKIGGKADALEYLAQNKIDVKKLPLKEISLEKQKVKFIDKIFGSISGMIGEAGRMSFYDKKLMAILN